MIPLHIKKKIEKKFGKNVRYSKDCEVLAISISKYCGETISASTVKRMFGLRHSTTKPRVSTLDIISNYVGYNSWNEAVELIHFSINQRITIHLSNELLILTYVNNQVFEVLYSNLEEIDNGDQLVIINLEENCNLKAEKITKCNSTKMGIVGEHQIRKIEYNDDIFPHIESVLLDDTLMIISTAIDLKIQMANNQWKKEMLYNPEQITNIHLQDILTEKTKIDMDAYKGILYIGASINNYLGSFIRKDNTIAELACNFIPIIWKNQYLGSIIISRKIIRTTGTNNSIYQ